MSLLHVAWTRHISLDWDFANPTSKDDGPYTKMHFWRPVGTKGSEKFPPKIHKKKKFYITAVFTICA